MKRYNNTLIWIATAVILFFQASPGLSLTISTETGIFSYGFKVNHRENSISIDKITIPYLQINLLKKVRRSALEFGYNYSYITQSNISLGYGINTGHISFTAGFSSGFFNNIGTKITPGCYLRIKLIPLDHIYLYSYLHTSFYLNKIFSLRSISYNFDQNILKSGIFYYDSDLSIGFLYSSINLYKLSGSSAVNDSKTDYQLIIETTVDRSWINSTTVLGGTKSTFKKGSLNLALLELYIDETFILKLKKITLTPGIKINILNFTLKDLKSADPPSVPNFSFHLGTILEFGR